jgi:hypothetical protein
MRDYPDRIAAPSVVAHEDVGNARSKARPMVRGPDGKVRDRIELRPFGGDGPFSGRFSHLLAGRGMSVQLNEDDIAKLIQDIAETVETYDGAIAALQEGKTNKAILGITFAAGLAMGLASRVGVRFSEDLVAWAKLTRMWNNPGACIDPEPPVFKRWAKP